MGWNARCAALSGANREENPSLFCFGSDAAQSVGRQSGPAPQRDPDGEDDFRSQPRD